MATRSAINALVAGVTAATQAKQRNDRDEAGKARRPKDQGQSGSGRQQADTIMGLRPKRSDMLPANGFASTAIAS